MTDPEKCIALVTLFSLIEYAMIPHGFDIEETDYDIISSDPGHCFVLLAAGGHLLWHGARSEQSLKAFPRSKTAAYILMGSAAGWFLYLVCSWGPPILDNIAISYL